MWAARKLWGVPATPASAVTEGFAWKRRSPPDFGPAQPGNEEEDGQFNNASMINPDRCKTKTALSPESRSPPGPKTKTTLDIHAGLEWLALCIKLVSNKVSD